MTDQKEMLHRASLRELGSYIMTGVDQSDSPTEPMMAARQRSRDEVQTLVDNHVSPEAREKLMEKVSLHSAVYYDSGFFLGMKVGARVLCALMNDNEITL